MKKLLFLLFLPSLGWSACPLYSFPENPKLDQEINNICQNQLNPIFNYGTASTMTVTQLNVSSINVTGSVGTLNIASGTVKSFMVVGTATNDNAPAGRIGEYVESVVTSMNLSLGSFVNFTSISLTPGDWDVSLNLGLNRGSASWTDAEWGISSTSADSGMGVSCRGDYIGFNNGAANINAVQFAVPSCRFSLSTTTTIFAPVVVNGSGTNPTARGRLSARRVR